MERKPNRLAREASPYLLQHAHNPVDWWPWSEEALAEAKAKDKPILLSIGYSACHWCHVMERESFENEAIARLMNDLFVNIKVDREERPDLDQIYQLVVQLMGRSGGWPLTVFLTPSQKPFFGGTYWPPEDRHGMPGFSKILQAIADAYENRRDEVDAQAVEMTDAIAEVGKGRAERAAPYEPGPDLIERATNLLSRRFDDTHGGFGDQPKFPNTMPLEVLLRGPARDNVKLALGSMRKGGIWDQLGGGFHRYSTDERWLVPHFEKMLYDNALLLRSYVDGHRVFGDARFAETAHAIASYVAREMTDEEGGFYASQDADSEGEEGKFFIWGPDDVKAVLGGDAKAEALVLEHYGITLAGNFEDHGRPTFKTVLSEVRPLRDDDERAVLDRAKRTMFEAREKRPKPFRDEKVLVSWSSLMISALADAGAALGDASMTASAERALTFIETKLVRDDRVERLGKKVDGAWIVKGPGFLDDYAFLANAFLDVYEATGAPERVTRARTIVDRAIERFYEKDEGFFFTAKDGQALITRSKDPYDNAIPSGTSMICRALLRLGALVDPRYAELAESELRRLAPAAIANPFGYGQALCELDRLVRGAVDVVVVGPRNEPATKALVREAFKAYLPNRTIAWLDPNDDASRAACSVLSEGKEAKGAYVCKGRTCLLPVTTAEELAKLLVG